jgi:hypothetical protein
VSTTGIDSFRDNVARWTGEQLERWAQTPSLLPPFLEKVSPRQKLEKERELDALLRKIPRTREQFKGLDAGRRAAIRMQVRTAVAKSLSPSRSDAAESFFEECERVADAFVRKAEEFDSALKEREIYQALRNQWVFNSIQHYLGRPVALTSSSFAYSLLYPYTDNRLDGPGATGGSTAAFLGWLSRRLEGVRSSDGGVFVEKIDELLRMIEEEYPRPGFPDVYAGLLAIHTAQQNSLRLRGRFSPDQEMRLLAVSIEKGGTSVLADGLLAAGSLRDEQAEVVFAYGVLLQLIDDLQDLDEDRERIHSTVFTRALERGPLDDVTSRLLSCLATCHTMMNERGGRGREDALPSLIGRSCAILVLEAIARHRAFYGDTFLGRMEEFSPLRFEYLGVVKERLTPPV